MIVCINVLYHFSGHVQGMVSRMTSMTAGLGDVVGAQQDHSRIQRIITKCWEQILQLGSVSTARKPLW